jgi:hypothetical protein
MGTSVRGGTLTTFARRCAKSRRHPDYQLRARENSRRYKRLRDDAYEQGWDEFANLQAWMDRLFEERLDSAVIGA